MRSRERRGGRIHPWSPLRGPLTPQPSNHHIAYFSTITVLPLTPAISAFSTLATSFTATITFALFSPAVTFGIFSVFQQKGRQIQSFICLPFTKPSGHFTSQIDIRKTMYLIGLVFVSPVIPPPTSQFPGSQFLPRNFQQVPLVGQFHTISQLSSAGLCKQFLFKFKGKAIFLSRICSSFTLFTSSTLFNGSSYSSPSYSITLL